MKNLTLGKLNSNGSLSSNGILSSVSGGKLILENKGGSHNVYFGKNSGTAPIIMKNGNIFMADGVKFAESSPNIRLNGSSGIIIANDYDNPSDRRIKSNITSLDDNECLDIIRKLNPVKYNYIEPDRTDDQVFGFIAQEVRDVLPIATRIGSHGIKDISANCTIVNGIATFNTDVHLEIGNELLISNENFEDHEPITITEHISSRQYRTNLGTTVSIDENLHIHGRLVKDFHFMKKDYIFTVATAAVQELDRQVQNLTTENTLLKSQLQSLEARLTALENGTN
jgi:hypothetical protein